MSGAEKSPDAYRTISEAAEDAGLPTHVLRFWESKFSQLKPVKRRGGRRFYRPQDVTLIKGLRHLLYEAGYTIKGAQKYLKDHGVGHVAALGEGSASIAAIPTGEEAAIPSPALDSRANALEARSELYRESAHNLTRLISDLEDVKARLDAAITRSHISRKAS
ncbi:MerR family transcriptional regulator [Woodsholea maritima]|uniref:MerR family transcriptional regulator n=1 Tax=Woodsholea maritima TaxID=240237 RepID=UPI000367F7BD|nr:MerR family transcriptional regulator [Woodsholea maritima]